MILTSNKETVWECLYNVDFIGLVTDGFWDSIVLACVCVCVCVRVPKHIYFYVHRQAGTYAHTDAYTYAVTDREREREKESHPGRVSHTKIRLFLGVGNLILLMLRY